MPRIGRELLWFEDREQLLGCAVAGALLRAQENPSVRLDVYAVAFRGDDRGERAPTDYVMDVGRYAAMSVSTV